jgi:hypothetical protein
MEDREARLWSHALFAPSSGIEQDQWVDEWSTSAAQRCLDTGGGDADATSAANLARRLAEDGILTGGELTQVGDRVRKTCPRPADRPGGP